MDFVITLSNITLSNKFEAFQTTSIFFSHRFELPNVNYQIWKFNKKQIDFDFNIIDLVYQKCKNRIDLIVPT